MISKERNRHRKIIKNTVIPFIKKENLIEDHNINK